VGVLWAQVHADNAKFNFARGGGGDPLALMRCYQQWEESNYSIQWCYENYVQARSMKKARDIREQLVGLCERVEMELTTSTEVDEICKALTAGFFFNCARLGKTQDYQTIKHSHSVYIYPGSVLSRDQREGVLHPHLVYHELTFTTKEYMRNIFPIKVGPRSACRRRWAHLEGSSKEHHYLYLSCHIAHRITYRIAGICSSKRLCMLLTEPGMSLQVQWLQEVASHYYTDVAVLVEEDKKPKVAKNTGAAPGTFDR
jgi:hypothetical protein